MIHHLPSATLGLGVVAVLLATAMASPQTPEPLRVFLRAGPKTHNPVDNGQHDYPAFLGAFSNVLLARGARVDGALHFPAPERLAETDVLVVYKGDGGMLDEGERAALDAFLKRGGGLVILHDGMCSDDAEWFAGVAGAAKQHGEPNWVRGLLKLHVTDIAHPVTQGLADFELEDEAFFMLRTRPAMHPLLEAPLPDSGKVQAQAWSYEHSLPGGQPYRSFVWMQGHWTAELLKPGPRDLILRGIAWAGHRPAEELLTVRPLPERWTSRARTAGCSLSVTDTGTPLHVVCPACAAVNRVAADRLGDGPRCGTCKADLFTGHPVALSAESFDRHVGRTDLPVVVDFWAPWCAPCLMMAPAFEQAAAQLEPHVRFAKLNTEDAPALAQQHGVRGIPTLALFRGGREVARQVGALPGPQLVEWIRANAT